MNVRRFVLASFIAFVVITLVEWIGHGYFMTTAYKATEALWRTQEAMTDLLWLGYLATIVTSLLMVFIYHKGYEGKGPGALEGFRFGIIVGIFMATPMVLWTYVTMPVTVGLTVGWFFIALIKYALAGIGVGLVYKK